MPLSAISIDHVQVQRALTAVLDGVHHPVEDVVERCTNLMQQPMGVSMEQFGARRISRSSCESAPVKTCAQGRLIDEVLTI